MIANVVNKQEYDNEDTNISVHSLDNFILTIYSACFRFLVEPVIRKHLGSDMPPVHSIGKNVSVILQHGHHSVTYPRPYLPGVVEIACLHCKPVKPLSDVSVGFI